MVADTIVVVLIFLGRVLPVLALPATYRPGLETAVVCASHVPIVFGGEISFFGARGWLALLPPFAAVGGVAPEGVVPIGVAAVVVVAEAGVGVLTHDVVGFMLFSSPGHALSTGFGVHLLAAVVGTCHHRRIDRILCYLALVLIKLPSELIRVFVGRLNIDGADGVENDGCEGLLEHGLCSFY